MFNRMCIIGVGLIGGSVARASRKKGLCKQIIGVGRDKKNLDRAVELGVIDSYSTDIKSAVNGADIVVICTPVGSFEKIFSELKPIWLKHCLYTDVGSTKESVVKSLETTFDDVPSNFVLGHPIAGSENNGVESSNEALFEGKRTIITPLEKITDTTFKRLCTTWWEGMGARVTEMTIQHHDEVLAATSHLPHVIAFALVELLKNKEDEKEIFKYAAGGFKDFTRIASSNPQMWADICMANSEQIVKLIKEYQKVNDNIVSLIETEDKDGLCELFTSAQAARKKYLTIQGH